jgi:hypothetical protein
MATVRLKHHIQLLLEAGLLREVEDPTNGAKKSNTAEYMVTPRAEYYFKALGDYYRKHRKHRI